jgi:hypothetical protein
MTALSRSIDDGTIFIADQTAADRDLRVFNRRRCCLRSAETGTLRGCRERCVDSTVFDDAVATQDTVIQLAAAMRKVAHANAPGRRNGRDEDGSAISVTTRWPIPLGRAESSQIDRVSR